MKRFVLLAALYEAARLSHLDLEMLDVDGTDVSNSTGESLYVLDGCPKLHGGDPDFKDKKITSSTRRRAAEAPVRCCSHSAGKCHSKEVGCKVEKYHDAVRTCEDHHMRLCTWHEMKTNLCCGTGCNFDSQMAWILDGSYAKKPSEFDPDTTTTTTTTFPLYALDGCPKQTGDNAHALKDVRMHESDQAVVRCCSFGQHKCTSRDVGCKNQTYAKAHRTCEKAGMRLCSWHEMKTNVCCGAGCNFDLSLAWIMSESYGKKPADFDPDTFAVVVTTTTTTTTTTLPAFAVDGCAKDATSLKDHHMQETDRAAVRCCGEDKRSCVSSVGGCHNSTYNEAEHICKSNGLRLCSWYEMKTNLCCGSGCNFDTALAWIEKETYGKKP